MNCNQEIQLEEYKLHNDSRLLNLENMKNELEYKKRLYPEADLANDEMTVTNLQKYLVTMSQITYISYWSTQKILFDYQSKWILRFKSHYYAT